MVIAMKEILIKVINTVMGSTNIKMQHMKVIFIRINLKEMHKYIIIREKSIRDKSEKEKDMDKA